MVVKSLKKTRPVLNNNLVENAIHPFEVIVIEDNHLTNTILCKALDSVITAILKFKKIQVKFSSFHSGREFLDYLENHKFEQTRLVVFSDYHLEENMTGAVVLRNIKQRNIDATVIIMSDTTNKQISVDAIKFGAYCFVPKNNDTPFVCSDLLFKLVE